MRPFKTLPLTKERLIYCSECSRTIIPFEVTPGATFQNYDTPAYYDDMVLPTVGEVWTTCKSCSESKLKERQQKETEEMVGFAGVLARYGCNYALHAVQILIGVGMLPFFPFGTFFGVLLIVNGIYEIRDWRP
jgi:hypothetical protein